MGLGLQKAERGWDNLGCYNEASRQLFPVSLGASQSHQLNLEEGLKGIKNIYTVQIFTYILNIYILSVVSPVYINCIINKHKII